MGTYDIFVGPRNEAVEIKMTNDGESMPTYKVGDHIHTGDCIIIGYEGAVVIYQETVIFVTSRLFDKWGNDINIKNLLDQSNPIVDAISKLEIDTSL